MYWIHVFCVMSTKTFLFDVGWNFDRVKCNEGFLLNVRYMRPICGFTGFQNKISIQNSTFSGHCCLLQKQPKPMTQWDDVKITLKQCTDDGVLCGIDMDHSNIRYFMETRTDSYFKFLFRRLVSFHYKCKKYCIFITLCNSTVAWHIIVLPYGSYTLL